MEVIHRQVDVGGIELHVAECGEGPVVLLCHGFPELWYSWRHQLPALAAAGYRAVAPDQRGYGRSGRPDAVEDYDIVHLAGDLVGLLDALGEERAVVVGHDWGAIVTWHLAQAAPERLHGIAALSVPFWPRPSRPPTELWKEIFADHFFYILHFQTPGVADAELDADPGAFMRRFLRRASADVFDATADVPPLPAWLSDEEFAVYEEEFRRTGFTGGLNWYRNFDRNWELTGETATRKVDIPAVFLAGERDPVLLLVRPEPMREWVPGLRESVLVPGAGHWIQQERSAETNEVLLRFLSSLDLPG
ncbi:MAG: alpha/beta hydrolase [Actinomycetota bacterium]|nr:alpha/beta hydrolase [Actinomycetota bacterium]